MRPYLFLSLFLLASVYSYSQSQKKLILGKWEASKLEHFDKAGKLDQEASDHFWNTLQGRTLEFKKDKTVIIPGYTDCSWYIKKGNLFMRYSATGKWSQDKILQLDKKLLKVKDTESFAEEGEVQVFEYTRVD